MRNFDEVPEVPLAIGIQPKRASNQTCRGRRLTPKHAVASGNGVRGVAIRRPPSGRQRSQTEWVTGAARAGKSLHPTRLRNFANHVHSKRYFREPVESLLGSRIDHSIFVQIRRLRDLRIDDLSGRGIDKLNRPTVQSRLVGFAMAISIQILELLTGDGTQPGIAQRQVLTNRRSLARRADVVLDHITPDALVGVGVGSPSVRRIRTSRALPCRTALVTASCAMRYRCRSISG